MPRVSKECLSQFVRTGCKRQLRLYLAHPESEHSAERTAQGMPDPQDPRPGLQLIRAQGEEWQALWS